MFIGSSVEGLEQAYAIQAELECKCEPTVWPQGIFKLTQSSLNSLLNALKDYTFAVFVMTPDDKVAMREVTRNVARDNVLFELGLFIGRHGIGNVFIVHPRGIELHLPTDLLGITTATYDGSRSDGNTQAALGPACSQIRKHIAEVNQRGTTPRQPLKYPMEMVQEFERLRAEYIKLLRKKLESSADIPNNVSLAKANLSELENLCRVSANISEFDYVGRPGVLLLRASIEVGQHSSCPATDLEIRALKQGLEQFRESLSGLAED